MAKLSGKIALVTGGSGALGSVVALGLMNEDARVIIAHSGNGTSSKKISELRKTIPDAEDVVVDVTNEGSVISTVSEILRDRGRIDILCNAVGGIGEQRFIEDIPLIEWNAMMTVNLQSCFLMMKHVIPSMKRNGFGRIINIAARPGVTPEAKRGGYGVSKAGVIALTKTVAEEVQQFGDITVNAVAPSIIVTEQNKRWGKEEDQKKWVTPDQITQMIIHLCSDQGVAINGQIINMYGKV